MFQKAIQSLNAPSKQERLNALRALKAAIDAGNLPSPPQTKDVNNHIHTTFSFSPYSPSKAVFMAHQAGLCTAGIIDHDSISGAFEFIEAGEIMELPITIGVEMRTTLNDERFAKNRINNPDQYANAYVIMHSVPKSQIKAVEAFLKPINVARGKRNKKIVEKINSVLIQHNISLDYEKDVLPQSLYNQGGSVTERHILFALSKKLIEKFNSTEELISFLKKDLCIEVSESIEKLLLSSKNNLNNNDNNEFEGLNILQYDLLGLLKAQFASQIYVNATIDECIDIREFVTFCKKIGAISCAPYLGDVTASITGDKKAQTFEDEILDELFDYYKSLNFEGCAYMPSRNTDAQIDKIQALSVKHNFIQISGEDINSPRQGFVCEKARNEKFDCLYNTTWALIGNEIVANRNIDDSIVSDKTKALYPNLDERIEYYKQIGIHNNK